MKTISVIILLLAIHSLSAQDTKSGLIVGSSGTGKTTTNTTLTWTIGQPIIKTFSNQDVNLSSGNQQTNLKIVAVPTGVEDVSNAQLQINVYPNPTQDQLTITFNDASKTTATYDLIAVDGTCIRSDAVLKNNQSIDVHSLLAGMYILNININNSIQSFQIIKQ